MYSLLSFVQTLDDFFYYSRSWFGPESEACGGPLCDRMVMSLQGSAYYVDYAYTYWGMAETDINCYYVYGGAVPRVGRAADDAAASGNSTAPATDGHAQRRNNHDRPTPGAKKTPRSSRPAKGSKRTGRPAGRVAPGRVPTAQVCWVVVVGLRVSKSGLLRTSLSRAAAVQALGCE